MLIVDNLLRNHSGLFLKLHIWDVCFLTVAIKSKCVHTKCTDLRLFVTWC